MKYLCRIMFMRRPYKILLVSLAMCCLCLASARAQEISISAGRNVLTNTKYITDLVPGARGYNAFDIGLGWRSEGKEAAGYGNPLLGAGFSWSNLGAVDCVPGSSLGDAFALYGFFKRDLLHAGPVSAGYDIQLGGALMTNPYHKTENPLNVLYGGPFTFHIKGGLFVETVVGKDWKVGAEVGFKHNSACRLIIPNRGLNAVCYTLSASYSLGNTTIEPGKAIPAVTPLDKRFRVAVFASGGIHKCMAEFEADQLLPPEERPDQYTPWFKGSVGAEVVWRYCRKTSTGLQAELHYIANTEALRRSDAALYGAKDLEYSPFAPGVGFIQDLYFGSWSVGAGMGVYLYRKVGIHEDRGPLYQKVFLKYYPPFLPSCFAGISLRAHKFNRADYLEFTVGTIL